MNNTKNLKIVFSLLLITFVFGVGVLSYLYFQVNENLNVLEKTRPMITKIYHNISKQNSYNSNVGAGNSLNIENLQSKIINAIQTTNPSVVNILISKNIKYFLQDPFSFWGKGKIINKKTKIGGGSGIIISKNGLIITNKHVVEDVNASYSVVLNDGTVYQALKVWFDPLIDIAILQVVDDKGQKPTNLVPAHFQDFNKQVKVGQFVLAIGNVLAEYQNSSTFGIISATNRQLEIGQENNLYIGLYQTDTSINPGNSGGPLIDIDGNVLGINTAINQAGEGIGFALPVNQDFIDSTILSITQHNSLKRPFLGIGYINLTKQIAQKNNLTVSEGALITNVLQGSSASEAGLQVGDIIVKINGFKITRQLPLLYNIYRFSPFEEISIDYLRGGKIFSKKIKLGVI